MKKRVNLKRKAEKRARKAAKKAAKQTRKPSSGNRAVKRDVKVKTIEDRLCWKLVGVGMIALAVFLALAFATFDWQSVRALCEDPHETTNLIGVMGNVVAYGAYAAFGLAAWCFPLAFLMGGLKLLEPIPKEVEEIPNGKVWLRVVGYALMTLTVTGLFQLTGRWIWVQQLLSALHIGTNAGGWIGNMFMTQGLEKMIAAFGAAFVSVGILVAALCMALGLKTMRKICGGIAEGLGSLMTETAADIEEGAERVRDRVREKIEEPSPPLQPPRVIRADAKPLPKIKYPANAELPPISLLNAVPPKKESGNDAAAMGEVLMRKLKEFKIFATLAYTVEGPTVTQFAIQPGQGALRSGRRTSPTPGRSSTRAARSCSWGRATCSTRRTRG